MKTVIYPQDLAVTLSEVAAVIAISIITITECKALHLSKTVLGVSRNDFFV